MHECALWFNGENQWIETHGFRGFDTPAFTVEAWFNWAGNGTRISPDGGALADGLPFVTIGDNQGKGHDTNINLFFGVQSTRRTLMVVFRGVPAEAGPLGESYTLVGNAPIAPNSWHHAAATYDGQTVRLFLDGNLDAELALQTPILPQLGDARDVYLAAALPHAGKGVGFFAGGLDEVRIWEIGRSPDEIRAGANLDNIVDPGLIGQWNINEGSGNQVADSSGKGEHGTALNSPTWIDGATMALSTTLSKGQSNTLTSSANAAPNPPSLVSPIDGATNVSTSPTLSVSVSDPESDNLTVTFYGRAAPQTPRPDFTFVAVPDTQKYTIPGSGMGIFGAQTQWIVDQQSIQNIVYVSHLGDMVDDYNVPAEWNVASAAMSKLEVPGIPYGIAIGNTDEDNWGIPPETIFFNQYFPASRFAERPYYGGAYNGDNGNSYQLFSASGLDFIVVNLKFNLSTVPTEASATLAWAHDLLETNSNRRAIVVTHNLLSASGVFSADGSEIYTALKDRPNLFLMLGGHLDYEAQRQDPGTDGHTIYSLRSDYQTRPNGGNGWLRLMRFSPDANKIYIRTYSPYLSQYETDADSQFSLDYTMGGGSFQVIGTAQAVPSGSTASITWPGLNLNQQYEWFAVASDGTNQTASDTWNFTTQATACYALTTSVSPVGSGTINATAPNCGSGFSAGTVVQLSAVPNSGYLFNNWSGGASGTANPVSITMDGDKSVTANLRETSATLLSPAGAVPAGWDGTFQWSGVTGASMYYVQILQADDTNVWTQWWSAADTCTGLACQVTLSSLSSLPSGGYKWRVLDWGGYGYGAWTGFTNFDTNPTCYALTTSVLPVGSGTINATAPNCGAGFSAGTVVQLSAVPNSGYLLSSWSGGASGTANPISVTMTGDVAVTANLRETSATLVSPAGAVPAGWDGTFQWSGVTGASMYYVQILQANDTNVWTQWWSAADNCTGLACHVTLSSLSSLPSGGYKWRVLDWGSYGYGAWTGFTNFDTNPACYALTTSVLPAGSGTINATAPNCGAGFSAGTVVQLSAVPNSGYLFSSWSGGASGAANPVSITMDGDKSVTANLRETSATLVSPAAAVPAGWDGTFQWSGVTGASMYYVQILQANDANVWTQWWSAADNCTGLACRVTLSSLSTLPSGGYKWRVLDWGSYGYGAWTGFTNFTTNPACYALTASVSPAGSGTINATAPNCGAGFSAGTVVQLSAVPNSGYVFGNWSGGASGTANPVSITMDGDKRVTANLRETSATLVSPSGPVPAGWDGTFQWSGVTGASMYYVQILQANDANVWTQWWSAADNCTGLACHVTLSSLSSLPSGEYKWRVLDWGGYGYGAWTEFTSFQIP